MRSGQAPVLWFGPARALGESGGWPARLGPPTLTVGGGPTVVAVWSAAAGEVATDATTCLLLDGVIAAPDDVRLDARQGPAQAALTVFRRTRRPEALDALRGRYAMIVADLAGERVYLRTDPLGFRGLQYAPVRGGWIASNDLASVVSLVEQPAVDPAAVVQSLNFYFLSGPRTHVATVRTVLPGTELTVRPGGEPGVRRYHRLVMRPEPHDAPRATWEDATDAALEAGLERVRTGCGRVGVLLSGGVDSSLLAAKAVRAGFDRCVAYSAELVDYPNPELERARRAATHLGIEHRVVPIHDRDIAESADRLLSAMQVPGADGGFVYAALFQAAAGEVDLLLHGEGADTLFGNVIQRGLALHAARHARVAWIPLPLRRALAAVVGDPRHGHRHTVHEVLSHDEREWVARVIRRESATTPSRLVPGAPHDPTHEAEFLELCGDPHAPSAIEAVAPIVLNGSCRYRWQWIDRLARAHGVGVAFPFLDDAVVAVGSRLPRAYAFDGATTKPVLRSVAARYLPADLVTASKLAFPTPTAAWLRGPLRPWVEAVERPDARVRRFLNPAVLDRLRWPADMDLLREVAFLERFIRLFLEADG